MSTCPSNKVYKEIHEKVDFIDNTCFREYRIDKLLWAAAKRGVQVNIIIYKEVTQALTLSSSHTKHWLEDNDKTGNIKILRHPDHVPDAGSMASNAWKNITTAGLNAGKLASLPGDALKGIYGMSGDSILYWAHHEKLCVVDGKTAFMGGLDLCFGRWDTNQHSIADAHPTDLDGIIFPGQDCKYTNRQSILARKIFTDLCTCRFKTIMQGMWCLNISSFYQRSEVS